MSGVVEGLFKRAVGKAAPPEDLTVDQWADRYRYIPDGSSPEPGKFKSSRTPYMIDIMRDVGNPRIAQIVLMFSAQMAKTELELNICGYYAHTDPCSMMYVMPTLATAEKISKTRLQPMIDCSPVLRRVFGKNRQRVSNSTILEKHFAGGFINLCGANSPASLSSSPMRLILADEVDRFPASAGDEGDPLTIAIARTKNFWNRKIIMVSTPTDSQTSRIEAQFKLSDQKYREVPCPKCGHFHELKWANFKYDKEDLSKDPWMECPKCHHEIGEEHKYQMDLKGRWTPAKPDNDKRISGYRINQLYSQFSSWVDIRNEWLDAQGSTEKLKTFTNLVLGEVWHLEETLTDAEVIKARREHYSECPEEVLTVVAGVDVQDDSLHYEIVGVGEDMQTWGLQYNVLRGDPSKPELWEKLDERMQQTFEKESGVIMNVMKVCIDSAGHHTQEVYDFCKKHGRHSKYSPIVGRRGQGKPIINNPTVLKKHGKIELYTVGTDTVKETFLLHRLKASKPGYGYCHYPVDRGYKDNYYDELINVVTEIRKVKGVSTRWFVDKPGKRVEAVDCRVYAMAAQEILNPNFVKIKATIKRLLKKKTENEGVQSKPSKKPAPTKNSRKQSKNVRRSKRKKSYTNR